MAWLEVLRAGARTTVQDRGRPGHAALGVGASGAADVVAHDAAN
ncbi:allophanate hydrolase subunit 2 family protein, partial [Rhodococcus hoagii]|nr:allophanate hydrolase subunit 2 family protein [Prescottella equi]